VTSTGRDRFRTRIWLAYFLVVAAGWFLHLCVAGAVGMVLAALGTLIAVVGLLREVVVGYRSS
jgi:hypothetical protein